MKKPKPFRFLKVFGRMVPAYLVDKLLEVESQYGYYEGNAKFIAVDATLRNEELEATVVHELYHAVLHRLHCSQQIPPEFEEVLVENLTVALFDNFKVTWRK